MISGFRRDFLESHPWTKPVTRKHPEIAIEPCQHCGLFHRAGTKLCPEANARIYVAKVAEFVKIGITTGIRRRFSALQNGCPLPITLEHVTKAMAWIDALSIEARIHGELKDRHVRGEWFKAAPAEAIMIINTVVETEGSHIGYPAKEEF